MDELKPCPLCGGEAFIYDHEISADWYGKWDISCHLCNLTLTTDYLLPQAEPKKEDGKEYARQTAIKRWERRTI